MFEINYNESFAQFWNDDKNEESILENDLLTTEGKDESIDDCTFMKPKQDIDKQSLPSLFSSTPSQQNDYLSKLEQSLNLSICFLLAISIISRFKRGSEEKNSYSSRDCKSTSFYSLYYLLFLPS